jgi:hypothetical protein
MLETFWGMMFLDESMTLLVMKGNARAPIGRREKNLPQSA